MRKLLTHRRSLHGASSKPAFAFLAGFFLATIFAVRQNSKSEPSSSPLAWQGLPGHEDALQQQLQQQLRLQAGVAAGGEGAQQGVQKGSPGEGSSGAFAGRLHGAPAVFVSFANFAFANMLHNWARSVEALGLPYLVGALDNQTAAFCEQRGMPYRKLDFGNPEDVRADYMVFRKIGAQKIGFVLSMLEEFGVQMVVLSDTDAVWLRDPTEYLQLHPAADWLMSTDCLSQQTEVEWKPNNGRNKCGHVPGNGGGSFNTGVFAVRNRPATLAVLRVWRDAMLNPNPAKDAVTDQPTLVKIMAQGSTPTRAIPEDPRTIWAANDTLKLHPLPLTLFAGGHVEFVQRLPEALGVGPFVVHSTYLRRTFATRRNQYEFKRARFREFGMWLIDAPSYYEGRFLSYDNDVRQHIEDLERSRGSMQPLLKHWAAAAYQLAQFRDALAVSRVTNRTLVLPPSWCWCEDAWHPEVVKTCRMPGTDLPHPFRCPADFVFSVHKMDEEGLDYRAPGFFALPQVPEWVRRSKAVATVLPHRPMGPLAIEAGLGHTAEVWPGMLASDLAGALAPFSRAAVLHVRGMRPGLFGGFDQGAGGLTNAAFDSMFERVSRDAYWCCTGYRYEATSGHTLPFELPVPLSAGWHPWQPPLFQTPDLCAAAPPESRDFLSATPNHPCQFRYSGGNDTAAKE